MSAAPRPGAAFSRRQFLAASAALVAGGILAACGGEAVATPTTGAAAGATKPAATGSTGGATAFATPAAPGSIAAPAASPVAGAATTATTAMRPTDGGELTVALSNEPPNLDPHQTSALISATVIGNIFDTLIIEKADQSLTPGLATKWEFSADGMQATLTLKKGVKFHDGEPFNAQAMKVSFDRMVDPATKSGLSAQLLGPYKGSDVVDDATIRMNFSAPFAPLFRNLARVYCAPVSPKAIQQYGLDVATHPVGTGPFVFKEYVAKDHLTLERNPDYQWAPELYGFNGPASMRRITWKFVAEEATRLATLRNGESQLIESVPPAFVKQVQGDAKFAVDIKPNTGLPFCLMVNTANPPTDDLAVRQALEYATDKATISNTINFGVYPPAQAPLSPVTFGYSKDSELYTFDVAKAKDVLDKGGWATGADGIRVKDGKRLTIEFWTLSDIVLYQNIAQSLQAQLKTVGMDMKIVSLARTAWGDGVNAGKHHLTTQIFGLADPSVLSINFHSKNIGKDGGKGFNWSRYANPMLDKLLDQGDVTFDNEKRKQIYADAQKLIMDQAIMVPIYYNQQVYGRLTGVTDITYLSGGQPILYPAYVKK